MGLELPSSNCIQGRRELTAPTVLALYDPAAETKVSAYASAYVLGAVLLQKHSVGWKPVAYASQSLSETECRYAQSKKEAHALTWACDKITMYMYLLSNRFLVEIDHKPLVPLLKEKHLDTLPPRVLRFRLCLDRFDFDIDHVLGKYMYTSDALSRAPLAATGDTNLQELAELAKEACISHLPACATIVSNLEQAQNTDPVCFLVIKFCKDG